MMSLSKGILLFRWMFCDTAEYEDFDLNKGIKKTTLPIVSCPTIENVVR